MKRLIWARATVLAVMVLFSARASAGDITFDNLHLAQGFRFNAATGDSCGYLVSVSVGGTVLPAALPQAVAPAA